MCSHSIGYCIALVWRIYLRRRGDVLSYVWKLRFRGFRVSLTNQMQLISKKKHKYSFNGDTENRRLMRKQRHISLGLFT